MDEGRGKAVLEYVEHQVLQPDEEIVWKGRPNPRRSATIGGLQFFFSLFFLGFAIFWTASASKAGLFALFGIPFLAVGAWMISTPIRNYLRALRTYYAITPKRILIVDAGLRYKVISIVAQDIVDYERTDAGDGSGDIRLRNPAPDRGIRAVDFADGLWGITDLKGATAAITSLQTATSNQQ